MGYYRDEGVVLRSMRLGEADRIVTILTLEHGKVRAVAKGVRRTKSRLGARLEPLSHVTLLCWRGRELDVVTQVEVIESFRSVREDLDALSAGLVLLEVADQFALERHGTPELFRMLLGALRSLERSKSSMLVGAFCWKLLAQEGLGPSLERCARCGEIAELVAFDPREGGFLCPACRRGQQVSPDAIALIRRILGGGLAGVLAQAASPAAREMEHLATLATEYHLDRRLRSARHLGTGATSHGG